MGDLMTRFEVGPDREVLADAAEFYGTATAEETIDAALRDAAARTRRTRALAELMEIAATGQFDELLDKRNRPWHKKRDNSWTM
jgi:Arc/MetJ family transcription regulator